MNCLFVKKCKLIAEFLVLLLLMSSFNFAPGSLEKKVIGILMLYIKNVGSIAINFQQLDSEGNNAIGILIIDQPYRFRINYFKPFPFLIVGDRKYVSIYDYDMETLTRIPAKNNPFNFLLLDEVCFYKQFKILSVKEGKMFYELELNHLNSNRVVKVFFCKISRNIKVIKISEEDKVITLIFQMIKKLTNVNSKLFSIQNPDIFGVPQYLDKKHLEENYQ